MEWTSVEECLPDETQAYSCTTENVHVKNSDSGFQGIGFLARTTTGPRWFAEDGKFELLSITHWSYKND